MKKYTVMTQIFNDYEFVREIEEQDPNAEYLLISDNPNLKSNTWQIIYDPDFAKLPKNEKLYYVKYHNFKYATTNVCIYVDGSILIFKSLHKLYDAYCKSNSFIGVLMHPCILTFDRELPVWIRNRKYPYSEAEKFFKFLQKTNYDITYKSYFLTTCTIRTKSHILKAFDNLVYDFICMNSTELNWFTIDQLYFAYVLNTWYNDKKIFLMHPQVVESDYMMRYEHNSTKKASLGGRMFLSLNDGYCFNLKIPTYKLV